MCGDSGVVAILLMDILVHLPVRNRLCIERGLIGALAVTGRAFCGAANERVYISVVGCEIKFGGTGNMCEATCPVMRISVWAGTCTIDSGL